MVYTIVIFIVQCQKHRSYRFILLLCSFFVSILFVFLLLFLYFGFSLVEICCYLPRHLLQSMYLCVFYSSSLLMSTCAYQFRCVKGIYCTVHTFGGRHDDGSAVETFNVTFIEKVQYTLNESVSLNTNYHHRAHTALITVLVWVCECVRFINLIIYLSGEYIVFGSEMALRCIILNCRFYTRQWCHIKLILAGNNW